MKKIAALIAFCLVGLWLLLTQYSLEESIYKCEGSLTTPSGATPQQMYLKLEKYRSWIFWSEGNWGEFHYELPQKHVDVFFDVRLVSDQLQVTGHGGKAQGNFSLLSRFISISTPHGFYDGRCEKIS